MKIVKKIIGDWVFVFVVLLLLVNLISFISIKFFDKDYPNILNYTYFIVQTGSMVPSVNVGDMVVVNITKDMN